MPAAEPVLPTGTDSTAAVCTGALDTPSPSPMAARAMATNQDRPVHGDGEQERSNQNDHRATHCWQPASARVRPPAADGSPQGSKGGQGHQDHAGDLDLVAPHILQIKRQCQSVVYITRLLKSIDVAAAKCGCVKKWTSTTGAAAQLPAHEANPEGDASNRGCCGEHRLACLRRVGITMTAASDAAQSCPGEVERRASFWPHRAVWQTAPTQN